MRTNLFTALAVLISMISGCTSTPEPMSIFEQVEKMDAAPSWLRYLLVSLRRETSRLVVLRIVLRRTLFSKILQRVRRRRVEHRVKENWVL